MGLPEGVDSFYGAAEAGCNTGRGFYKVKCDDLHVGKKQSIVIAKKNNNEFCQKGFYFYKLL